jgi:hypothetical protein
MKMFLYTVFDVLSEDSGPVFCQRNHAVAHAQYMRMFDSRPDSVPLDPAHYDLYCLGFYDSETMVVVPERSKVTADVVAGYLATRRSSGDKESGL